MKQAKHQAHLTKADLEAVLGLFRTDFMEKIDGVRGELKADFSRIENRFDGVDKRLGGVDKRLDGVDKRLDGVDKRLDGVDKRLDGLDQKIDKSTHSLGQKIHQVWLAVNKGWHRTEQAEERLSERIREASRTSNARFDAFLGQLETHKRETQTLPKTLDEHGRILREHDRRIGDLESRGGHS